MRRQEEAQRERRRRVGSREREEGEPRARGRGSRRKRRGEKTKTLRVLHLDQGMTDNVPADHLSAPLFDDKAHPPSTIHYQLSLPEARASIMLPLRDAAPPTTRTHNMQAWPSLVGTPGCTSLPPSDPPPTCWAADHPPHSHSHSEPLFPGLDQPPNRRPVSGAAGG